MILYRTLVGAMLLAALLAAQPARADDDAARARAAMQAGEVVPLDNILAAVRKDFNGEVIEIELDREDGRWVYEVKLIGNEGAVAKLEYDAKTAQLTKSKGAGLERLRKR